MPPRRLVGGGAALAGMNGLCPPARLAVCAAAVALAAALAPVPLLGGAAAQTDESLPEFNPDGTQVFSTNGANSTLVPPSPTFSILNDVAFDSEDRMLIADRNRHRVVVLDSDYNFNFSIGDINPANGHGIPSTGSGAFDRPSGVDTNSTQHIFVPERNNNRVSIFSPNGSFLRHIDRSDDASNVNQPKGIGIAPDGRIYVTPAGDKIHYFHPDGSPWGTLNTLNSHIMTNDAPDGLDIGTGGLLAVAHSDGTSGSGHYVSILNMSNHEVKFTLGTQGYSSDEGQFYRPRDISFSSDGRLLAVMDGVSGAGRNSPYRVQVFLLNTTNDGVPTGLANALPVFVIPTGTNQGVAFDSAHRLAIADNFLVRVYELALPAVKSVVAAPGPDNASNAINASILSAGRSAIVDVSFNTNLTRVNTTAGTPYLALGPDRNATLVPYNYSAPTRTLQFTYTVQDGDTDADFEYNPDTALRLNGSAIAAGPRNVTVLTALPWTDPAGGSLWAAHGIAIDTERPELRAVYSPNASAAYTNGSRIVVALNYSDPVWAVGSDSPSLALNVATEGGGSASASYLSGNGTVTLSFSYEVQPGDSAPGGLRHAGAGALSADASIVDVAGNAADSDLPDSSDFAGPSIMVDTLQPRVTSVGPDSPGGAYRAGQSVDIAVTFGEPVTVTGTPMLALATDPPRNASYVQGMGGDADLLFRYEVRPGDGAQGGLRHAGTDALTGGSIADAAGNAANRTLPAPSDFAGPGIMVDTAPPRVTAVNTTLASGTYGIGQTIDIAVTFDEVVTVDGSPMLALATDPPRNASYVQGMGGDAELLFRYEVRPGDSAPDGLQYNGTGALGTEGSIVDTAGNAANRTLPPPGPLAMQGIWLDAVPPRVVAVESVSTSGTYRAGQSVDIAVTFDENVTVTGNPMLALATSPLRSALYVGDTDGDADLLFRYEVRPGDGAPGGLRHAGTDALTGGSIADAVGNAADLTLPAQGSPGPLAGIMINTASMGGGPGNQTGNAPTVAIGPDWMPDGRGDLADRGPGVNVTIDVSGLPGAGTAGGTVQFPQRGATVTTSFASVSFPPSATATSVPADGMLVLRVVEAGALPSNSSIQRILAYDGSGAVALQRVVEVGDENTRIVFDKPVRISLEGQAGGRAFYIAGAGGTITPIDDACGADDADRVHRHLNGTGECRIESDGDMVIYTYHLTRFGTVSPENDATPPVYYTCSVALEKPALRIDDARLEGYSTPVSQRLFNTGSAEFERVGIEATRWQPNLGAGSSPGAGVPSLPSPVSMAGNGTASSALVARVDASLPASLTEVREETEGGAYAAVGEGTAVAAGLGGGDDRNLWFKLNLTQYSAVQGKTITQSVTYNVQCTEPQPG